MCVFVCVCGGGGEKMLCVCGGRCWKQNCFLGGGGTGSAAKGGLTEKVGIPYL